MKTHPELNVFAAAVDGPGIFQVFFYIKITFVKAPVCHLNLLKTADAKRPDCLLQVAVPDQIKTLIPRNQVIRINLSLCEGIPGLGMIDRPNAPLLQNRADNRLQEVPAFFAVSRFTHLNNISNIFKYSVLFGFFLQMGAHDLIISSMKPWGDFVLVQK
ncbi:hypothetical protein D3C75_1018120 [compost metagenome]